MKKTILGFFVCMLLIAVPVLSVAGNLNINKTFREISAEYSDLAQSTIGRDNDKIQNYKVPQTNPVDARGYVLSEDFEGTYSIRPNQPSGWVIIDNNGDGYISGSYAYNMWGTYSSSTYAHSGEMSMRYEYNYAEAADDWFFSSGMSLSVGELYELRFWSRVYSSSYSEKMRVFIGTGQTIGQMTTELWNDSNMTHTEYRQDSVNFSIPSSGTYYLGFQAYSDADQWNIYVDDINVRFLEDNDVGVTSINEPSPIFQGGFSITPEITVKNFGKNNQTDVPVHMEIFRIEGIFYEGFEGSWPPAGWTTIKYSGTGDWEQAAYAGPYTYDPGGTGNYYAGAIDDGKSGVDFDVGLFTPSIDCTPPGASATLEFMRAFQDYAGHGQAAVNTYSGGTGAGNFEEQLLYLDLDDSPSSGIFTQLIFDPTGYTNPADVYIEFWYTDDPPYDTAWGFTIDDVFLGSITSSVLVYDEYEYVDLLFNEVKDVKFPDWTPPAPPGGTNDFYTIVACSELGTDEDPSNDCQEENLSVFNNNEVKNLDTGEDFHTIQGAIDDSDTLDGHTIYVEKGVYYENVLVDKSLNLVGEDKASTVIDAGGATHAVRIARDWVNISGFTVRNSNSGGTYVGHSSKCTINNCESYDNRHGIVLFNSSNNSIRNCTFYNNSDYGIYLSTCSNNNLITHCEIYDNTNFGIHITRSNHNSIIHSSSHDNSYGMYLYSSNSNNVSSCNFSNNSDYGMRLWDSLNNTITKCTFYSNDNRGIYLSSSSNNNIIYHNNILNNAVNAYESGCDANTWDDGYPSGGNFWDDYTGEDNYHGPSQDMPGGDGIGDTFYDIPGSGSNKDNYPFMFQDGWLLNYPPLFDFPIPANGSTGNPLSFFWQIPINDLEGDSFDWSIECSNGQSNSDTGDSNGTKSLALSGLVFSTTYTVWVNATDPGGGGGYTREWYTFTTKANNPPYAPSISGKTNGKAGTEYEYTFTATDPEVHDVSFYVEWGDETSSGWTEYVASETEVKLKHTWAEEDTYTIRAKAKDEYGAESDWGTLEVSMPVNKVASSAVARFFRLILK